VYLVMAETAKDGLVETHEINLPSLSQASIYLKVLALSYEVTDSLVIEA